MITIDTLTALLIIPVLILCMCVGWSWKHLTTADNKYIPVVVMVLGGILACIYFQEISITVIGAGFITGIASCGCYDLLDNFMRGASNGVRADIELTEDEAYDIMLEDPDAFEEE